MQAVQHYNDLMGYLGDWLAAMHFKATQGGKRIYGFPKPVSSLHRHLVSTCFVLEELCHRLDRIEETWSQGDLDHSAYAEALTYFDAVRLWCTKRPF